MTFFTVTVANAVFSLDFWIDLTVVSLDFWIDLTVVSLDFWIKLTIVCLDFWINIVSLQRLELGKVAKNALKRVGKSPFSV